MIKHLSDIKALSSTAITQVAVTHAAATHAAATQAAATRLVGTVGNMSSCVIMTMIMLAGIKPSSPCCNIVTGFTGGSHVS